MKLQDKLDYESLRRTYLLASTPNYLYKYLRRDRTLEEFAKSVTEQELRQLFTQAIKDGIRDIDDLLTLYAIIVGLTFKECSRGIASFFDGLNKYDFQWVRELGAICAARSVPTIFLSTTYPGSLEDPKWGVPSASTTITIRRMKPNIQIEGDST